MRVRMSQNRLLLVIGLVGLAAITAFWGRHGRVGVEFPGKRNFLRVSRLSGRSAA